LRRCWFAGRRCVAISGVALRGEELSDLDDPEKIADAMVGDA
jgi:hypothetical protein